MNTAAERLAPVGQIWQTGLLAGAIATVGNLIVYAVASAAGVSFNFLPPDIPAPPFPLVAAAVTMTGAILGTLLLTLMPRFTPRPLTRWRQIAIIALVLSFFQPLLLTSGVMPTPAPVELSTIVTLEIMHVLAGVTIISLLTTRTRAA